MISVETAAYEDLWRLGFYDSVRYKAVPSVERQQAFLIAWEDEHAVGCLISEELPWESEVLKRKVCKLMLVMNLELGYTRQAEISDELLQSFHTKAQSSGIKLVSARVPEDDLAVIHSLERQGFQLIETYLTFTHDLAEIEFSRTAPLTCKVRPFREEDIEKLENIAYHSFTYSRFHSDPLIDRHLADVSRAEWILNSCRGRAEEVFVADVDGQVVGFVVCRLAKSGRGEPIGILDLIAVSKDYAGRGIGSRLVKTFLSFYKGKTEYVSVGTQAKNIPSVRLYEKCGFRLSKSELTFHKHF